MILILSLLILLSSFWNDPYVNQENRLPMRATLDYGYSVMSLDGQWDFQYDGGEWGSIPVPGMWELNGYGDPVYINHGFAWRGHYENNPPFPPEKDNHQGVYRKTFILDGHNDEDVILRIGAVTSNAQVWLNGVYVGYSEDSKLEADFDITDILIPGENTLILKVMRWCDGTYLEDQDFWRMSGISRSVGIICKPRTRMENLNVNASASGKLDMNFLLSGNVARLDVSLRSQGLRRWHWSFPVAGDSLHVVKEISSPKLWSAETPYLYTLEIKVRDKSGRITQKARANVGFRDVEIRGTALYVNGKPVLIKGVNHHEMNPYRGYCLTREDMLEDIRQLKLLNINAVRTSHYPKDPYWYELCDHYGIYVLDEANVESHGIGYKQDVTLADKEEWGKAHSERLQRMIQRDRNHPSIIMWSLGNEAGWGRNHARNYEWAKAEDSTRPTLYYGYDIPYTDIDSYMYRTPDVCVEYATDSLRSKPFMLMEYAHAMGNSLGNFKEYWELIRKYPNFIGGFIWDFADQALIVRDSVKVGGDFNDYDPWNVSLHCNGLLSTDRKWHPHAWEAKYQMRNIHITARKEGLLQGMVNVTSEFFFKKLRRASLKWTLLVDGEPVKDGSRRFSIGPHEQKELKIGYSERTLRKLCPDMNAHDVRLQLSVLLGKDDGILKKGDEIAWEDLPISEADSPVIPHFGDAPRSWTVTFDNDGFPSSWVTDGNDILGSTIRPCFGRAITENDKGVDLNAKMKVWLYPEFQLEGVETAGNIIKTETGWTCSGEAGLTARYNVADAGKLEMKWTVTDGGELKLSEHLLRATGAPLLFRVGVEFAVPGAFSTLDFHGAGPYETYADRKSSARIARYSQNVADQYHYSYVRPQESGNHTDLRYMALLSRGSCLVMKSDSLFSGSALPFSREDMDISIHEPEDIKHVKPNFWCKHFHSQDLVPDGLTHVHADLLQMGVGGIDTWKSLPLKEYLLDDDEYTFNLTLIPRILQ